jgi:acetylornithine deacetylase/succinyl-diaminopimelate desuccinylase family protein
LSFSALKVISMRGIQAEAKAVADTIEAKDVIRMSQDLVRIPSVYHNEHKLGKFIFKILDKWGLSPRSVPVEGCGPDVVSETGPSKAPCIVFNGHMDTVEVMAGWKHDPFGARIENGMMYGLGTLDMKCSIASMLLAYKAIAESRKARRVRFVFQAVTGEEDTGMGTWTLAESGAYRMAKAVIVGEGFGGLNAVTIGRRGASYFDINVYGMAAHGATPEKGINAIADASKLVAALDGMKARESREMKGDDSVPLRESQTVLRIQGGSESLSVPEKCYVYVVRYMLPGTKNNGEREIRNTIKRLGLRSSVDVKMKTGIHQYQPYRTPPDSLLVRTAIDSIQQETGSRPRLLYGLSEADDNKIAQACKAPIICFGPGESGALARYHQPEEAVSISQLGPAARAYATVALTMAEHI